ncbi:hypothetical protein NESM_000079000 [Novymonas esmeraldas]|uniref:Treble clef zinc finger domain-containing protein n=1 Tax=Novymonas esmeraldas TaxID=1808958 RepID=A0AAW0F3P9_9TRYP
MDRDWLRSRVVAPEAPPTGSPLWLRLLHAASWAMWPCLRLTRCGLAHRMRPHATAAGCPTVTITSSSPLHGRRESAAAGSCSAGALVQARRFGAAMGRAKRTKAGAAAASPSKTTRRAKRGAASATAAAAAAAAPPLSSVASRDKRNGVAAVATPAHRTLADGAEDDGDDADEDNVDAMLAEDPASVGTEDALEDAVELEEVQEGATAKRSRTGRRSKGAAAESGDAEAADYEEGSPSAYNNGDKDGDGDDDGHGDGETRARRADGAVDEDKASSLLSVAFPELAAEYDAENTTPLSEVRTDSAVVAAWRCPQCSEVWRCGVFIRCVLGNSCPSCRVRNTVTLVQSRPDLLQLWDHSRNDPFLRPAELPANSSESVYWSCPGCSESYLARVKDRVMDRVRCPACALVRSKAVDALSSEENDVLQEWHPLKNGDLRMDQLSPTDSRTKVWWLCAGCGHEWRASLAARLSRPGRGRFRLCPVCQGKGAAELLQ